MFEDNEVIIFSSVKVVAIFEMMGVSKFGREKSPKLRQKKLKQKQCRQHLVASQMFLHLFVHHWIFRICFQRLDSADAGFCIEIWGQRREGSSNHGPSMWLGSMNIVDEDPWEIQMWWWMMIDGWRMMIDSSGLMIDDDLVIDYCLNALFTDCDSGSMVHEWWLAMTGGWWLMFHADWWLVVDDSSWIMDDFDCFQLMIDHHWWLLDVYWWSMMLDEWCWLIVIDGGWSGLIDDAWLANFCSWFWNITDASWLMMSDHDW